MIFVAGTMTLEPSMIGAFERDVKAMSGQVRNEDGCHHYSLLVEDAPTGLINVLESWRDDAALAVHLKQPWILTFVGVYMKHLTASTVLIYDIAGCRPLP